MLSELVKPLSSVGFYFFWLAVGFYFDRVSNVAHWPCGMRRNNAAMLFLIMKELGFFSDLLSEYSQWLPLSKHDDLKDCWPPAT